MRLRPVCYCELLNNLKRLSGILGLCNDDKVGGDDHDNNNNNKVG